MMLMRSRPRPEFTRRLPQFRAFAARALRAMADQLEPVTTESVVVRTQPYGFHGDFVIHSTKSATR